MPPKTGPIETPIVSPTSARLAALARVLSLRFVLVVTVVSLVLVVVFVWFGVCFVLA